MAPFVSIPSIKKLKSHDVFGSNNDISDNDMFDFPLSVASEHEEPRESLDGYSFSTKAQFDHTEW
jgi:hypothetical protein